MAQRVNVELVCDIDDTAGASEVAFGLDGVDYTIDLSDVRAEDLRDTLRPFIEGGRRVGGRKIRSDARPVAASTAKAPYVRNTEENAKIRAWAEANGITVGTKGRIAETVKEKYQKALSAPATKAPARKTSRKKAAAK
ncbi:histone-like nucleoid-structuring protein Lsr2 [Amycolatopsis japonica]